MRRRPSERRWATICTMLLAMAMCGCASIGMPPSGAGDVYRIKMVVDPAASRDSAATTTEFVQIFREGLDSIAEPRAASEQMVLAEDESLSLASMWRTRLRLTTAPAEWEWVVLAPELMTAQGDMVPEGHAGGTVGRYSIGRSEGRTMLDLHQGAVVLRDWGANTSEGICVRAAGVCAVVTNGASFAVFVDANGVASLYVESGDVTLASESSFLDCRAANAPPDVACGIAAPELAKPGTAWEWLVGRIPTQGVLDPEDEERWQGVIRYNGEELWRERVVPGWAPWLLVPAAIVGCIATDFWICGGDDSISGTVIVVGS